VNGLSEVISAIQQLFFDDRCTTFKEQIVYVRVLIEVDMSS